METHEYNSVASMPHKSQSIVGAPYRPQSQEKAGPKVGKSSFSNLQISSVDECSAHNTGRFAEFVLSESVTTSAEGFIFGHPTERMGIGPNILGIAREPEYGLPERNTGSRIRAIDYKKTERSVSDRVDTIRCGSM